MAGPILNLLRLTRAGLNTAQRALHEVLQLLAQFAAGLEPGDHVAAAHAALALHRRAFALLVPSPLSPPASS